MAKTFVIADVHGRLDLLEAALARIENHAPGKVVFTGDFIDGGPQSRGVVARLIAGPSDGWEWVFVRGNHETCFWTVIRARTSRGGSSTAAAKLSTATAVGSTRRISNGCIRCRGSTPTSIGSYVHAGVDECYDLDQQPAGLTQWYRYPKGADVGYRGMHVVHGHTPRRKGPELLEYRTNLDTNAYSTGRLVVGVFDDEKAGGPVKVLEVHLLRSQKRSGWRAVGASAASRQCKGDLQSMIGPPDERA